MTLPDALIMMPGQTLTYCDTHGYQPITGLYSLRKALGIPSSDMLPDEPLFLSAIPT